jgi:hypothetical protein
MQSVLTNLRRMINRKIKKSGSTPRFGGANHLSLAQDRGDNRDDSSLATRDGLNLKRHQTYNSCGELGVHFQITALALVSAWRQVSYQRGVLMSADAYPRMDQPHVQSALGCFSVETENVPWRQNQQMCYYSIMTRWSEKIG